MKKKLATLSVAASMLITPAGMTAAANTAEAGGEQPHKTHDVQPGQDTGLTETADLTETAEETENGSAQENSVPVQETEDVQEGIIVEGTAEETQPEEDGFLAETEEEVPVQAEEPVLAEEEQEEAVPYRDGTDIKCSLTLDTMADGEVTDTLLFHPGQDQYEVQVGGTLNLSNVWKQYGLFKTAYVLKNGKEAFRSKNLTGSFTYTFEVNPAVVSANRAILESPQAWQTAFETGSGEKAAGFFTFMKCTGAAYDETTGTVTVTFTIDENGTGMVSVATLEDLAGARPASIDAYSPQGALTIQAADFEKGAVAVPGNASFKGVMDMSPWMAMIFPIRYEAETQHAGLSLDVPDANVSFAVENGTWADGTSEPKLAVVPMDIVQTAEGTVAAGTLTEDMVPAGMLAAEGFDQNTGAWNPALNLEENGVILPAQEGDAASYTYSFQAIQPEEPDTPEQPEEPTEPDTPEKPGDGETPETPEEPEKPGDQTSQKPAGSQKPSGSTQKPNTDVFTEAAAFAVAQGAAAAGGLVLLKKKKDRK